MSIQDMEIFLNNTHISISSKIEISTENFSSNIKEINIGKFNDIVIILKLNCFFKYKRERRLHRL